MYPPKVGDTVIRAVIRTLTAGGKLPSGVQVRTELSRRYGSRGGVARIYRLLAAEAAQWGGGAAPSIGGRLIELENQKLREQLRQLQQQTRQRDETHQSYWGRRIAELQTEVGAMQVKVEQALATEAVSDGLKKALQETDVRAGRLEIGFRAFGPATVQHPPGQEGLGGEEGDD